MSMRLKTTLLIILIVFVSTAANFFLSWYFTNENLKETIEQDLTFAIGIANKLVSAEMNLIKSEAITIAERLSNAGSYEELLTLMAKQVNEFRIVSGLTIFGRDDVVANYSIPMHSHEVVRNNASLEKVYGGATILSSPFFCSVKGEFAMNIYTPFGDGEILAVTIPGSIFSELLSGQTLWKTGNIFILNEEGGFVGAVNPQIASVLHNLSDAEESEKNDERNNDVGYLISKVLSTESGAENYSLNGVESMCVYSRIASSTMGWRVAITVPLAESPQADALRGQMFAVMFLLIIGVFAAFFLSRITDRPFRRIEIQNRDLEKLAAKLEAALSEAEKANSAKSSFLAHMSHEIRTPLNAVIGLSELTLSEEDINREAASNLEKIYNAGSTILSIVNDVLDISKIESGKFDLYPVKYDSPSIINDIVSLNIVRIGDKPVTFKLYVDENLPGALYGDDLRVKQIFNNLLSNAFKYTNSGSVEWRVSFEEDSDGVWLKSSVKDTGIGIKPEDVQKLFSEYNQVDKRTNRRVSGTGLGLAIAKRLVDMMGGAISVESEYGKGATFSVRLRQSRASDLPVGKDVAENLMSLRYTFTKRIGKQLTHADMSYAHVLVVDDIVTNLDVVKGMMKPYGLNVDCALSGPQAIEMIQAGVPRYSAIFMDHMMPGMDGIEAARIIREEIGTEYARKIPIIALTANAIVGNEEMFLNQGFQAFISKPIDIMKLDSVLRRWVRDKNKELSDTDGDAGLTVNGNGTGEKSCHLLRDITISGLDKHLALDRFGGDEAVLIDVLRSYAVNTRTLAGKLKEYIAAEKIDDYAIAVHGVKGASYGIFASEVGKAAKTLEIAAKAGNFDEIRAGNAGFEKILEALLDNIDKALAEIAVAANKPAAPAPDPAVLNELRDACAVFDMDGVDAVMEKLEAFRYESGGGEKLVAWLREQVNNMAFEKISGGEWPSV